MAKFIPIKFEFEDTETVRQHLSRALGDESWLDKAKHPNLHIHLGMLELEALFIVTKALGQHGAMLQEESHDVVVLPAKPLVAKHTASESKQAVKK